MNFLRYWPVASALLLATQLAPCDAAGRSKALPTRPSTANGDKKPKLDPVDQPFTPDERGLLRPPFLPTGWKKADATLSGSIHSPLEFGNFFQRPEFKTREHDGRLYYTNFKSRNVNGRTANVAFVRWTPLNAKSEKAQHIRPLPGYTVEGFETDGKLLEIQQYPEWPKKIPIKVQHYRWEGDQAGNGRFVLQSTKNGELPPW